MKKTLKIFLTVLLAVTAAVCTVAGLSACGGSKLESITVENARTDFKVGGQENGTRPGSLECSNVETCPSHWVHS